MNAEALLRVDGPDWPRQELFSFFSQIEYPFYTVSLRLDVTKLYAYAKAHGLSFYHALVYFCTQSLNTVENFRYTIRGGGVYLLPRRAPSFTHLQPGSDLFRIITLPCGGKGRRADHVPRPGRRNGRSDLFFVPAVVRSDLLHERAQSGR